MYFAYGETFGINPPDVPDRVPIQWWIRWRLWKRAQDSRDAWNVWRQPGKKPKLDQPEQDAKDWALFKDRY